MEFFQGFYLEHCLDSTELYPGVEDMLQQIDAAGVRQAVLTNKPRNFTEKILEGLGVRSLFSGVLGGDDLPTRKPDPEGLERLAADAGCTADEILMVGDSPVDLATASAAGAPACAVVWGFSSERELRAAGNAPLVSSPTEILEFVI